MTTTTKSNAALGDEVLRVELRFKNARLYDAIVADKVPIIGTAGSAAGEKARQLGCVSRFCEFHGLQRQYVYELINLRMSPYHRDGAPTELATTLAALLEVDPLWLFPVSIYAKVWQQGQARYLSERDIVTVGQMVGHVQRQISDASAVATLPEVEAPDRSATLALDRKLCETVFARMTAREVRVIKMRYGWDGAEPMLLEQVGRVEQVTRERIRQIEAKAMWKLRHGIGCVERDQLRKQGYRFADVIVETPEDEA